LRKPSLVSAFDYEDEEHETNRNNFNSKEKEKIAEWIKSLSVGISKNFTLNKPVLEEFKDG
jgi:hypothetical protein